MKMFDKFYFYIYQLYDIDLRAQNFFKRLRSCLAVLMAITE